MFWDSDSEQINRGLLEREKLGVFGGIDWECEFADFVEWSMIRGEDS